MKKILSLAVALAMIVSVVPMFGLTAAAATETTVLFDAADIDTSTHGDIQLTDYGWTGNEGGAVFSSQWSDTGTWNAQPWGDAGLMFFRSGARSNGTDETKVATFDDYGMTVGAEKVTIDYIYATQEESDNYQRWHFLDVDDNELATVYTDAGSAQTNNVDNAVVEIGGLNGAAVTSLVSHNRAEVLALRGVPFRIEITKAGEGATVVYSYDEDKDGTYEEIATETAPKFNGFKSITANIPQWNKQYAAMALQGLKITADVDASSIAEVTVRTVLSDGKDSGVEDITVLASAGQEYTYTPKSTAPIVVDGTYYVYKADKSTLTITPKAEGENVIELYYEKFDGDGITGSVIADGATCWFADPRTLTVKGEDGENFTYIGYIDNSGNVRATQYDNETGDYEEVLVRSNLQPDDHNNPAFLELPDHHIMIIYSRHTDERGFYYRVSKEPYDITTLAEEKAIATNDATTYPNPFILKGDPDHIYMGWRGIDWHPTLAKLDMPTEANDYTLSFVWGPQQIVRSNIQSSGCRPYAKYASDGENKIWLTYTGTHPDNVPTNPIYCNYIDISDLTLHDAAGKLLQDLTKDRYVVSGSETESETQVVYREDNVRGWVWEIALADDGNPVIAMVKIDSSKTKHDYWLAHFDGTEWKKTDLPDPEFNTTFHENANNGVERCYSGGMSIDKADPHVIYASVPVDGVFGRVFEIVKYTVSDDYGNVTTEAVTENSLKDNARPYVANGSEEGDLRLTWFNGDYYYWIHSSQNGGKGYPVQMMTDTELKPLDVTNNLGDVNSKVYAADADNTVDVTSGEEFTVSMNLLQDDISKGGVLFESGDLKVELEKITNDLATGKYDKYDYAAVAPKITAAGKTEKSQNLFSDADWYLSLSGTNGDKGVSPMGWINYTVTYDGSEVVTYVNGLIDATIQGVDGLTLDATAKIGGIDGIITNFRSTDKALTQAEVRAAMEEFDPDSVNTLESIEIPTETAADLVLPKTTADGKTITWTSDDANVIIDDGIVTRDGEEHQVVLTAAAGDQTKDFTVTVPAKVDVTKENMVLHYDFNDVTGDVVPDLSANGYDAEVKGTAAKFDNGKLDLTANTASGWDTNGYLNVPYDFMKDVRSYSVVEQISGGTDRNDPRLYDFGKNTGNSVFTRLNTVGGANQYQAGLKYNNESTQMVAGKPFATGEYWLVTTYSAKTKETKVYTVTADGIATVAQGNNVVHEPYEISGSTDRNYIGRTQWSADSGQRGNNQDFNGTIDNFMFFNTALTEDEIKAITTAKVSAEAALRITKGEDGTVGLGITFTANVTGTLDSVSEVGFVYAANAKADDGTYTKAGATAEVKLDKVADTFALSITGISNANSARTYTAQPYIVVNGQKIYGETVKASLYDVLIDSIVNAKGASILPERLAAANSVIAFVKKNRKDDSEAKFPGLKEASAKLYDADGKMIKKAADLGISDAESAIIELAAPLSLDAVEIEFADTEITDGGVTGDITADMGFVPEL